jgi:hypothetical protein
MNLIHVVMNLPEMVKTIARYLPAEDLMKFMLVSKKYHYSVVGGDCGWNIMDAIRCDNVAMLKIILRYGRNNNLNVLVARGCLKMVKSLRLTSDTMMEIAVYFGHSDIVEYLRGLGCVYVSSRKSNFEFIGYPPNNRREE